MADRNLQGLDGLSEFAESPIEGPEPMPEFPVRRFLVEGRFKGSQTSSPIAGLLLNHREIGVGCCQLGAAVDGVLETSLAFLPGLLLEVNVTQIVVEPSMLRSQADGLFKSGDGLGRETGLSISIAQVVPGLEAIRGRAKDFSIARDRFGNLASLQPCIPLCQSF